jgi:hypothetical protein
MIQAIPNVIRIVLLMLLFYVVFGTIAIGYFKGRFYSCYIFNEVIYSINNFEN